MPGVFVCYQKSSTQHAAGRLYTRLSQHFGTESVFRDVSGLRGGEMWWVKITQWIQQADALVVVIGNDWLKLLEVSNAAAAPQGGWVQREIVTAMESAIGIIPVLVDGASLPPAGDLPSELATLGERQAVTLHDDTFDLQLGVLVKELEEAHGVRDPRSAARRRWERAKKIGRPIAAVLGAFAAILAIWAFYFRSENRPPVLEDRGQVEAVAGVSLSIDILGGASDPDGDVLSLRVEDASAMSAVVTNQGDGTVEYLAPLSAFGVDQFGYEVIDSRGATTADTVFVDVLAGAMDGTLNVAVADFVPVGDAAEPLARVASELLNSLVMDSLGTDTRFRFAGPDRALRVAGDTFEAQRESVVATADRLNADAILFGVVSSDGGSTEVLIRLHLGAGALAGADELAGSYELDRVSVTAANAGAVQFELERKMGPTVGAIGSLLRGLIFYQVNQYPDAEAELRAAVASWPVTSDSTNGQEVLWHLLGNIAGEQGRLEEAAGHYQTAIDLGDDDARARFGLAEVQFLQSRGKKCGGEGDPDVELLDDAAAAFAAVRQMPEPPLSFLDARSRVEIGRVLLCLTLNKVDRAEEARGHLAAVVADYSSESRLVDLLGEAHQSLALYHTLQDNTEAAIEEYELAIATTNEESRRAFFHAALGGIYQCDVGNLEEAIRQYALSDALVSPPLARRGC